MTRYCSQNFMELGLEKWRSLCHVVLSQRVVLRRLQHRMWLQHVGRCLESHEVRTGMCRICWFIGLPLGHRIGLSTVHNLN